jgi:alpha/beta superfamily hydrolase
VDSRGYGSSGGCYDLGGSGEQADAKAAVEWAASQSWSTGKVGMWGKSYDAWTQVMAMATKAKGWRPRSSSRRSSRPTAASTTTACTWTRASSRHRRCTPRPT